MGVKTGPINSKKSLVSSRIKLKIRKTQRFHSLRNLTLTCQDTCMYEKVHSSINCDSPKVEMSHMSAN